MANVPHQNEARTDFKQRPKPYLYQEGFLSRANQGVARFIVSAAFVDFSGAPLRVSSRWRPDLSRDCELEHFLSGGQRQIGRENNPSAAGLQ